MRDALRLVLVGGLVGALCAPAPAALLCKKRSGVLVVREACKKKEALLDLSQLGALGPQGDPGPAGPPEWERPCPPDSVAVGTACIDKYEASVWSVPADNTTLVAALRAGTASREDLGAGGVGEQVEAEERTQDHVRRTGEALPEEYEARLVAAELERLHDVRDGEDAEEDGKDREGGASLGCRHGREP